MMNADRPAQQLSGTVQVRDVVVRRGRLRQWLRNAIGGFFVQLIGRPFQLLFGGPVYFQIVRTACQLNLFGVLKAKPGLTLPEIARELKIDEYPAGILLMGCVALRLVRKSGSQYRLMPLVGSRLGRDHPRIAEPLLEWMHHVVYRPMFYFLEAVREGRAAGLHVFPGEEDNLYQRLSHDPNLEKIFHDAMQVHSRQTNALFLERIDFSRFRRILDVGGSSGENVAVIAQRHANVQATVFDFPTVAERARLRFQEQGLADRLSAVGGNIFEDAFPTGHDCVLFCHFTPIFSDATNRTLMKRAFEALTPGGIVCIYAPFMNDRHTGPLKSAMLSPYFLCVVNGQGRHYSWQESSAWLSDAGFIDVTRVRLQRDDGVILAAKPR